MRRGTPPAIVALALTALAAPLEANAQDFVAPGPPLAPGSPLAALERGTMPASSRFALASAAVRWHGVSGLDTRAIAAAAGWRSARIAAGLSQTGDPAVGWTAAGLAAGVANRAAGAGIRAVGRRDRTTPFTAPPAPDDLGVEIGGAAWVEAGAGLDVWCSAPQLWNAGAAPPLARGMELGLRARGEAWSLWLTREAARGPAGRTGVHTAGLALALPPVTAWIAGHSSPARGAFGLSARAAGIAVAAEVEGHPVLGETVRLSLGILGQ